jgi:hypothetical protein
LRLLAHALRNAKAAPRSPQDELNALNQTCLDYGRITIFKEIPQSQ